MKNNVRVELKFDKKSLFCCVPKENYMKTLTPRFISEGLKGDAAILAALSHPIGTPRLKELVHSGEKILIVISDITRPLPSYRILPYVLTELISAGIKEKDMTIVIALGSHRKHTEKEKLQLVGPSVYKSAITILDSDVNHCIRLGMCQNGTPVDIFSAVAKADFRICIGNVEYHYFAGYSGGNKALMPGVSSLEAIQANHSNMLKPGARSGNLDTNPVRQDIDQISDFLSIDFILNVVLDEQKDIIMAVAGHSIKAHRVACAFLDRIYKVPVSETADIVLFSSGGFPKDINLYQAQKGLDNASQAVRDGGILIWCASAKEGFGQTAFEDWMKNKTPEKMILEIQQNFQLGAHKAAAIATVLKHSCIYLISDLPDSLVRQVGFTPFPTLQTALDCALNLQKNQITDKLDRSKSPKVLVMPLAGSTLPVIKYDDNH